MAFAIDPGALHRPLGFSFAVAPKDAGEWLGAIGVERFAGELPGASAARIAPGGAACSAAASFTARQMASSAGVLRGVLLTSCVAPEVDFSPAAAHASTRTGWPEATLGIATVRAPSTSALSHGELARSVASAGPSRSSEGLSLPGPWLTSATSVDPTALVQRLAAAAPVALASARGVVEGQRVSLLFLAQGALTASGRTPLALFLLTDARLSSATLELLLAQTAERCLAPVAGLAAPLPGDNLTALATGLAHVGAIERDSLGFQTLRVGACAAAQTLVRELLLRAFHPDSATVVQITVTRAREARFAAARAEAIAAEPALATLLDETSPTAPLPALFQGAALRRDPSGRHVALSIDLQAGSARATRWTALRRRG